MKLNERTSAYKVKLANKVIKAVYDQTESFRESEVGSDLAYLVWAILDDSKVMVLEGDEVCGYREVIAALSLDRDLWNAVKPYFDIIREKQK